MEEIDSLSLSFINLAEKETIRLFIGIHMCACVYFWIILVSRWYPLSTVPVISKLGNTVGSARAVPTFP